MAKYFGIIGYAEVKQINSDTSVEVYTERKYRGDIIRNVRRLEKGDDINSNLKVNNLISIVADAYAHHNFFAMRYLNWMGASWKITNVEVQSPRLILTIGEVYPHEEAIGPD